MVRHCTAKLLATVDVACRLHNVGGLLTSGTLSCSLGDHGARTPDPRDQPGAPNLRFSTNFYQLPQLRLRGKPCLSSFCPSSPDAYCGFIFQPLSSGDVEDDLMSAGEEGPQPGAEPGRTAQRTLKSSAFTSSLSWDSDSEKEALDGNSSCLLEAPEPEFS